MTFNLETHLFKYKPIESLSKIGYLDIRTGSILDNTLWNKSCGRGKHGDSQEYLAPIEKHLTDLLEYI